MDYYNDIYLRRLNRYGTNFQERIQNRREENFTRQLQKSIYLVEFEYDGKVVQGELTHFKEDESKILQYLLTEVDVNIPGGTVLEFYNSEYANGERYMVYYDENYKAKGYNKYIMLRMTHYITWFKKGEEYHSWAYMFGQENNMLKDEIRSRSRMDTLYAENLKASFFIMPLTKDMYKDDYFEVQTKDIRESYRVTGLDRQSTDGVMFVTIDPIYFYDHSKTPEYCGDEKYSKPKKDSPYFEETTEKDDYYWLDMRGGNPDGTKC